VRRIGIPVALLLLLGITVAFSGSAWARGAVIASESEEMAILDDCDPADSTWAPTGACELHEGDVNRAEFNALLLPPLTLSLEDPLGEALREVGGSNRL
jgi:hypothetical protein